MGEIVDFRPADILQLRKPHPCGGLEWEVTRVGADIGLQCLTCGHRMMLGRTVLEKRMRQFIARGMHEATIPGRGVRE